MHTPSESIQILYRNYLYNKHKAISWKCKEKGCNSTLNADIDSLTVTRKPSAHKDHPEITSCRVALLKAINKMKNAVKDESTVSIRVIYDRYLTSLQDQKFNMTIKKKGNRVLIFMSGYGIMWLRESKANHSDGTF